MPIKFDDCIIIPIVHQLDHRNPDRTLCGKSMINMTGYSNTGIGEPCESCRKISIKIIKSEDT
jgi:hypothetical protein